MLFRFAARCGIPAKRFFCVAVLLLSAALLTVGCLPQKPQEETTTRDTRIVLGTVGRIQARGTEKAAHMAVEEAYDLLTDMDTNPDRAGVLAMEAAAGTGEWTEIPAELYEMLTLAQSVSRRSGGAFDVTAGALTTLWAEARAAGEPPTDAEIRAAMKCVGYESMELRERSVNGAPVYEGRLMKPGMQIDRGGLIKGYALDEILLHWDGEHLGGALADLGASSMLGLGTNAEGEPWQVGIRNPRGKSSADMLLVMPLSDEVLSASGDDERYFIYEGKRYHHLIDPRTGYPADTGLASVTVILPLAIESPAWEGHVGILSDMLSTAIFVLGPEKGRALLSDFPAALVILIGPDGKVLWESP